MTFKVERVPAAEPKIETAHDSGYPFLDDGTIATRLADGWKVVTTYATISGHVFIHWMKERKGARGK